LFILFHFVPFYSFYSFFSFFYFIHFNFLFEQEDLGENSKLSEIITVHEQKLIFPKSRVDQCDSKPRALLIECCYRLATTFT